MANGRKCRENDSVQLPFLRFAQPVYAVLNVFTALAACEAQCEKMAGTQLVKNKRFGVASTGRECSGNDSVQLRVKHSARKCQVPSE